MSTWHFHQFWNSEPQSSSLHSYHLSTEPSPQPMEDSFALTGKKGKCQALSHRGFERLQGESEQGAVRGPSTLCNQPFTRNCCLASYPTLRRLLK